MPATITDPAQGPGRTAHPVRFLVARALLPLALAAGLGWGLDLLVNRARAETTQCTAITTLPTTISTQGIYCLTSDFNLNLASGNAITITANNVVLDLNGHKVGNLSAGPGTTAYGIFSSQQQNITVKNGTVRGFIAGVSLSDISPYTTSQGHLVENIRADQNTVMGIAVFGRGNLVRRNQVVATGGTTALANANGDGILVTGDGTRVIDNDIMTVTKTGSGIAFGILFTSAADEGQAINNRITDAERGIGMSVTTFQNKYRDNLTTAVTTPYTGGHDAGNNN